MTLKKELCDLPDHLDDKKECADFIVQKTKEVIFKLCEGTEQGFINQKQAVGSSGETMSKDWSVKQEKFEEILVKEEKEELENQSFFPEENEERLHSSETKIEDVTAQTMEQRCLQQKIECPSLPFVVDGLLQSNSEILLSDGIEKLKRRRQTIRKYYKCSSCPYKATQMGHLKRHERTHSGEKPFKCSTCPYKAALLPTLKQHERIHLGEKPFKCSTCPYKASQKGNLEKHERTHTGEKPFRCNTCPYQATIVWNLKQHERTHIGEKPFKCSACPYSASQMGNLKRHERTHSGDSQSTQHVSRMSKNRLHGNLSHQHRIDDPNPTTS